jgi:phage tail-like protein
VSEIGVLSRSTEVVEHREGGDPGSVRKSPGRTRYKGITLEGGVTHDMEFEQWANNEWSFGAGPGAEVSPRDRRKSVVIEVYYEAGQVATTATESPARTSFRRETIPGCPSGEVGDGSFDICRCHEAARGCPRPQNVIRALRARRLTD